MARTPHYDLVTGIVEIPVNVNSFVLVRVTCLVARMHARWLIIFSFSFFMFLAVVAGVAAYVHRSTTVPRDERLTPVYSLFGLRHPRGFEEKAIPKGGDFVFFFFFSNASVCEFNQLN